LSQFLYYNVSCINFSKILDCVFFVIHTYSITSSFQVALRCIENKSIYLLYIVSTCVYAVCRVIVDVTEIAADQVDPGLTVILVPMASLGARVLLDPLYAFVYHSNCT